MRVAEQSEYIIHSLVFFLYCVTEIKATFFLPPRTHSWNKMFHFVLKSELKKNLAKYLGLSGSEDTTDLIFDNAFPNSSPRFANATQTIGLS